LCRCSRTSPAFWRRSELDAGSRRIVLGDPALSATQAHRIAAVEAILTRADGEGMPFEAMPEVRHHARRAASEWRNDQEAAIEIEASAANSPDGCAASSGCRMICDYRVSVRRKRLSESALHKLRVEPDAQDISLPPDQITGAPPVGAEGQLEPRRNYRASCDNDLCAALRNIHDLTFLVRTARLYDPRANVAGAPDLARDVFRRDSHPTKISQND
jgi:hypothetical protein